MIGKFFHNRYRVVEKLGEGGMGVVYKAWDTVLERHVALKMIKRELSQDETFFKRFQTEAKALARLGHPNIVRVYDLFESENDWFIAMEYVAGLTLAKKVEREGPLPSATCLPILKQILSAIGHAHQAGIIHRDLKPGNIILDLEGNAHVTDFGLAKIQAEGRLTVSTSTGGTLFYMSPEQVKGQSTDHRSDIYSIGMTCYEALAGKIPFKKTEAQIDVLNAIVRNHFPPPDKFNPDVPKDLARIIMKAMSAKPAKRYQSAEEMLAAVEELSKPPIEKKQRRIRLVFEIVWSVVIVCLTAGFFVFTDWDTRALEALGLSDPTRLTILTTPDSAEVRLNGKRVKGLTPIPKQRVRPDTLHLHIEKDDFFAVDTMIVLQKGQDSTLFFNLMPKAMAVIVVQPSAVEVFLDGRSKTHSELSRLELSTGEHRLFATLAGYNPLDTTVSFLQGTNPLLSLRLTPVTGAPVEPVWGKISITSDPPGAEVELRGTKIIKNKTPVLNLEVPVGRYQLIVRLENYEDFSEPVTVDGVRPVSKNVRLNRITGSLELSVTPPSAIYLDNELQQENANRFATRLPTQTYVLKIVHATLGWWADTLRITSSRPYQKNIDFNQKYRVRLTGLDMNDELLDNAEIYVDGIKQPQNPPAQLSLHFGVHDLEIKSPGYEAIDSPRRILLESDLKEAIIFRMRKLP